MKRVILAVLLTGSGLGLAQQRHIRVRSQFERFVPQQMRAEFCSTLTKGFDAQRRRDWKSLYSIVLPQHRGKSQEDFVEGEQERDLTILDFRIDQISPQIEVSSSGKNGMWDVLGCTLVEEKGNRIPMQSAATVYQDDGSWYFDMIEILTRLSNPPPSSRKCNLKEAVPITNLCGTS